MTQRIWESESDEGALSTEKEVNSKAEPNEMGLPGLQARELEECS